MKTSNMAAVWKLPAIFLCENNRYAITTSVQKGHGQPDIARRADMAVIHPEAFAWM